ncbi:unnamed protein product [Ambrosiozyma monospora]|uniref:Unnamed protein product n=1 Tax=Ambrosiozyma monospora TaxID=43982 RepID=A0ACB5SQW0_AMBMO|nr:unnamed protein product [Ambrosiozyma monospora]
MTQIRDSYNNFVSQFPLEVYPSTSKDSKEFKDQLSHRRFSLRSSGNNEKGLAGKVNLGVYSLSPLSFNESVLVSLDPVSLADMLILANKTHSNLPLAKPSTEEDLKDNPISISILSHYSSPEGDLPMLIEDEQNNQEKKIKRKVRSCTVIEEFNLANVTDIKEMMFIKAINNKLYDFFFASIFQNAEIIRKVYTMHSPLENIPDSSLLDKLTLQSTLSQLSARNQFSLRYPTISAHCSGTVTSYLKPGYFKQSLEEEIGNAYIDGFAELSYLTKYYSELGTKFFFTDAKTGGPSLFDLKLASFVYCILELSGDCEAFAQVKPEAVKLGGYVEDVLGTFF